jgi:primosomal protein N' (replication factor Y)
MADYYFANPADCLSAALPSAIRNSQSPDYYWVADSSALIPATLIKLARNGKRLSPIQVKRINESKRTLLKELLAAGVIEPRWTENLPKPKATLVGYRLSVNEIDASFASGRDLEHFQGVLSRQQLSERGWSAHFLKKGIEGGILEPVHEAREVTVLDFVTERPEVARHTLSEEQAAVLNQLSPRLGGGFSTSLLHGITGSGKTLVYCHLVRKVVESGRTALVLTPEIALSGSTLAYFRGFFGDQVTVIHSSMSERERLASWRGIREGRFKVVIGPRSALFAPLVKPGLIIVDEEHDPSYKQDEPSPRFHGRDAAIMRGRLADIPVLLGSATPSIESYHNALSGRYYLLNLRNRPAGATLPKVELIDMKEHRVGGELTSLSFPLKKRITERLKEEHQVILYLNRRGYAPYLKCKQCGEVPGCPQCNIKLTYHRAGNKLTCHYCDYHQFGPGECKNCQSTEFEFMGAGTQKVEESLPKLIKGAVVARFDSDSASGRERSYRILKQFAEGCQNILLGTQMVTKGLDLPKVTLVGVLSADFELDLPDFRASERTFARLVQVAGRAGRREQLGEVWIQTYNPELSVIVEAARQDYETFFHRELESRKAFGYPPFARLVRIVVSGADAKLVIEQTQRLADRIDQIKSEQLKVTRLGPSPCPLGYLRGLHRQHIILKTAQISPLIRQLTHWELNEPKFGLPAKLKVTVDVDPIDLL